VPWLWYFGPEVFLHEIGNPANRNPYSIFGWTSNETPKKWVSREEFISSQQGIGGGLNEWPQPPM
jgi:hypothetical protein